MILYIEVLKCSDCEARVLSFPGYRIGIHKYSATVECSGLWTIEAIHAVKFDQGDLLEAVRESAAPEYAEQVRQLARLKVPVYGRVPVEDDAS